MSMVRDLRKLISTFHKNYSDKPIAISLPINTASLMTKKTKPLGKNQMRGRLSKASSTDKRIQKNKPLNHRCFIGSRFFLRQKN